jgi:hypothetical protein
MNGEERETSTHVMKPKTSRSTGDQEPQSGRTPWLSAAAKGERDLQTRLQGGREREGFEEWRLACVDLSARPSAFFPLPFPSISPLLSGGLQRISKYRGVVMVHGSIQGKGGGGVAAMPWRRCTMGDRRREEGEGEIREGTQIRRDLDRGGVRPCRAGVGERRVKRGPACLLIFTTR